MPRLSRLSYLLVAIKPAGQGNYEKVEGMYDNESLHEQISRNIF